ncbi:MAG: monoheme cytochrome C [Bacteroidota bacterium]
MPEPSPAFLRKLSFLVASTSVLAIVAIVLTATLIYLIQHPSSPAEELPPDQLTEMAAPKEDRVEDGIDVASGFVAEGEYQLVKTVCTACHSGKLVTQNRATREGWEEMIRWMQETQKLWELGESEDKILDYLATYYAPENQGRRANIVVEEWYVIEQ